MRLYKLTDGAGMAPTWRWPEREFEWREGVTHEVPKKGLRLNTPDVIHAFEDPATLAFMYPDELSQLESPILWEAEGDVVTREGFVLQGVKRQASPNPFVCGVKQLTVVGRVEIPKLGAITRIRIAIRCALTCCDDPAFVEWSRKWLSGEDRSKAAAESARAAIGAAHLDDGSIPAIDAIEAVLSPRREVSEAATYAAEEAWGCSLYAACQVRPGSNRQRWSPRPGSKLLDVARIVRDEMRSSRSSPD